MINNTNLYLECQCELQDHIARLSLDPLDGELTLSTHISQPHPWYKRLWLALKYLFNSPSPYGHFDSTLIKPEQYSQVIDLISQSQKLLPPPQESSAYSDSETLSENSIEFQGTFHQEPGYFSKIASNQVTEIFDVYDLVPTNAKNEQVDTFKISISCKSKK